MSEDASELVRTLLDVAPSEVFEFQRVQPDGSKKGHKIRVQMLRVEEEHQVLEAAQAYAKSRHESPAAYGDLYKEGQAVALLTKALRRVDKRERNDGTHYYPPLFTGEQQLRQSFTAPEMAQCLNMYEIVRSKYGSALQYTEEELDDWVERLGDPLRGPFFLSLLDSCHWPNLLLQLAQEVQLLRERDQAHLISPDTSESDPSNSGDGTGSSMQLPSAHLVWDEQAQLPTDRLLSPSEAQHFADQIYGKKSKSE